MLRSGLPFWSAERSKARAAVAGSILLAGLILAVLRPLPVASAMGVTAPQGEGPAWLKLVPNNAVVVGGLSPQKVAANSELRAVMKTFAELMHHGKDDIAGNKPENWESTVIFLYKSDPKFVNEAQAQGMRLLAAMHGSVIRSSQAFDMAALEKLFPKMETAPRQPEFVAKMQVRPLLLDDKTLLLAPAGDHDSLKAAIEKGASEEFAKQAKNMSSSDGGFLIDSGFLKSTLAGDGRLAHEMMMFSPLWNDCKVLGGKIKLGDKVTLSVFGIYDSADAARKASTTLEAVVTMNKNMLDMHRQQASQNDGAKMLPILDLGKKALDNAKVTTEGEVAKADIEIDVTSAGGWNKALMPHLFEAKKASGRNVSVNNLKQIALAFHNYHDSKGSFPASNGVGPDGKTKVSWRVLILPYIDQDQLFKQYKMDEPWDSPNNSKLLAKMPKIYQCPGSTSLTSTCYFAVTGDNTVFPDGKGVKLQDISDGTSNTILVVEAKRDIPWTKPDDIAFDGKEVPEFGGFFEKIFNTAFCDGSVRAMNMEKAKEEIKKALTRNGGEVMGQ